MKKFISIIIAVMMIASSVFCFSGCSCIEDYIGTLIKKSCEDVEPVPKMEQGDFIYRYVKSADQNHGSYKANAKYIAIVGLTEEGEKKKTLVIPEKIEGMDVILIGMSGLAWSEDLGGTYEKIYLPKTLQRERNSISFATSKVFLVNLPNEEFFKSISGVMYVSNVDYVTFCNYAKSVKEDYDIETFRIANLTYIVDGNVYWIDDYDEGEQIVFPEEPKKEGFTFEGWYKEPELINKWNVEEDVYTKDESLNTVNLYAKFEII